MDKGVIVLNAIAIFFCVMLFFWIAPVTSSLAKENSYSCYTVRYETTERGLISSSTNESNRCWLYCSINSNDHFTIPLDCLSYNNDTLIVRIKKRTKLIVEE